MQNIAFLYDNLWDGGSLLYSSQHPSFPAANTQQRLHTIPWRTRYGAGMAGGNFVISATNKFIDFDDGSSVTATLAEATYSITTLMAEIKAKMDAVGGQAYTVTYSAITFKFNISGPGTFSLLWQSGGNAANSIGSTIGYNVVADDTGSASYTADYVRIHTEEWVSCDLGSAQTVQAFALKGHNLSSTAVVRIQANTANVWTGTPPVDVVVPLTAGLIVYHWASALTTYRYFRYKIVDINNPDGYSESGRVFLGPIFSPGINISNNYRETYEDPSVITMSSGGQISSNQFSRYRVIEFSFEYSTYADAQNFISMFTSRGQSLDFFVTRDRDISGTTVYVRMTGQLRIQHVFMDTYFSVTLTLEELR